MTVEGGVFETLDKGISRCVIVFDATFVVVVVVVVVFDAAFVVIIVVVNHRDELMIFEIVGRFSFTGSNSRILQRKQTFGIMLVLG